MPRPSASESALI